MKEKLKVCLKRLRQARGPKAAQNEQKKKLLTAAAGLILFWRLLLRQSGRIKQAP